jgi:hypothetical protein
MVHGKACAPSCSGWRAAGARCHGGGEGIAEPSGWRHNKLYNKLMILHCVLASEEDRAAIAERNGWRHALPTNVSLEEQIHIL